MYLEQLFILLKIASFCVREHSPLLGAFVQSEVVVFQFQPIDGQCPWSIFALDARPRALARPMDERRTVERLRGGSWGFNVVRRRPKFEVVVRLAA